MSRTNRPAKSRAALIQGGVRRGALHLPTGLQVVQHANGHFRLLSSEPGLIHLTRLNSAPSWETSLVDFTENGTIPVSLLLAGITVDLEPVEKDRYDLGVKLSAGATP